MTVVGSLGYKGIFGLQKVAKKLDKVGPTVSCSAHQQILFVCKNLKTKKSVLTSAKRQLFAFLYFSVKLAKIAEKLTGVNGKLEREPHAVAKQTLQE